MNIENKLEDKEYIGLVQDILDNDNFCKTKKIIHHGLNRFDHSMRVSYYSYKLSKILKLDYREVARAGLLHDFFYSSNDEEKGFQKIETLVNHPKYALANAKKDFELTEKEQNIIVSHMFPLAFRLPKYLESWLVNIVDNFVAVMEAYQSTKKNVGIAVNFMLVIMLNFLN